MLFLYDECNVKLQMYANGFAWSMGGKHLNKLFHFLYVVQQKQSFQPIFWIGTYPMWKPILEIIRGQNQPHFPQKKYRFLWTFYLAIFMEILHWECSTSLIFSDRTVLELPHLVLIHHWHQTKGPFDLNFSAMHVSFMCLFMAKYFLNIQLPRKPPYLNYAFIYLFV